MEDTVGLLSDPQKVAFAHVETIDEKEHELPLLTTTVPSSSKLPAVSIEAIPISRATDLTDTTEKIRRSPVALRDTSWAAWRVLCGAILVQGVLFAFPLTFGVFQDFFGKDQELSDAALSIWIGVLSTGLPFMGAPFMTALCENHIKIGWRYYVLAGWVICTASLIGASFSKSLLVLTLTQGMLYGVGLLILDVPTLLILNTWFVKRRGTAYGLLFGVTDLIGFGATILVDYLLREHGFKGTLLGFGCALLAICGPAMWLLKPRPTDAPIHVKEQDLDEMTLTPLMRRATSNLCPPVTVRYYRRPMFYIFTLANLFHSFGYYLPFIYLPSYTTSLGYSATRGAYLLAAANFAQIFGEVSFGQLSDHISVHWLVLIGSLVSSVAAFTLWGLAGSLAPLTAFALIFGSFGSGLISLWARMGTFFGQQDAQMIYSIMSFGRGIGSIVSGPISSALLATSDPKDPAPDSKSKYGNGKYLGVILFVGVTMAISALMGAIGLIAGWHRNEHSLSKRKRGKVYQNLEG